MKDMKSIGALISGGGKGKDGEIDSDAIRELAALLTETSLTEIEIEHGGSRIRVARQPAAVASVSHAPMAYAPPPTDGEAPAKPSGPNPGAVPSPMVGTVYVAPEPGKPPFVKVGSVVKEGDTLFIVEAMKTMNPILAPRAGTVSDICITDSQPVEFGQTLLILS